MSNGWQSSKARRIKHKYFVYERAHRQEKIAFDIRNKDKLKNYQPSDINLVIQGQEYFYSGISLEEAPENLKNNINFINGYDRAKRFENRKLDAYDLGFQYFIVGKTLDEASEVLKNNLYFNLGYNDAYYQSLIDGIDWQCTSINLEEMTDVKQVARTRK